MDEIVMICLRSPFHRACYIGETVEEARANAEAGGWKPVGRSFTPEGGTGGRLYLCPKCARREEWGRE